jgi:homoserine O-acetyltransferase/O-succinyltransferase
MKKSVGIVKTQYLNFDSMILESNEKFGPITIAYETYGKLNNDKSNAILILHALTGDSHAAGFHNSNDKKPGWWDSLIGENKAFDTNKYFIICSNVLGGCKGSTGPSSINPKTKKHYGLNFPLISIYDMVKCQKILIEHLGIKKLLSVTGGSMGGMQVVVWMMKYPSMINSAIVVASSLRHTPQQIAFNEVARQAIMSDDKWENGNYYGLDIPLKGLAVARMLGHITYMSDVSMENKFSRRKKNISTDFKFNAPDYEVEQYLHYHSENFLKRFDANSYLYITKAMDNFDPIGNKQLKDVFDNLRAKVLVVSFKSDWLYPTSQSKEIVKACKLNDIETTFCEIDSTYGHDAFLLEIDEEEHLFKHFLDKVYKIKV